MRREAATGHWPAPIRAATPIGWVGWRGVIRWCGAALARRRQRIALAALHDHLLKDIGLTRGAARTEAAKRLWR